MKALATIALLFAVGQAEKPRLYLDVKAPTESTTRISGKAAQTTTRTTGLENSMLDAFTKGCPTVAVTRNRTNADYVLEVAAGEAILSNAKGDVLAKKGLGFWSLSGVVKEMCPRMKG